MSARIPLPHDLAARPFTLQEGLDRGLGDKRLRGADLQHPYRGVRIASSTTLTLSELCHALQSKLPRYASFCGVTAAVIMGIPLPMPLEQSRVLHVCVPSPHRAPVGKYIHGHAFRISPGDVRAWHGLRLTTPERTWCELASLLTLPDLVAAGDFLVHWRLPLTTIQGLQDAAAAFPGRRGIQLMRVALPLLSDRSESRRESRLRVIVVRARLTGLAVNLRITTTDGHRYRADLAFPAKKVLLEYQSEFHRSPEAFRADMTRISRLEADGWYVMQVNSNDLEDPDELVRRIHRVLDAR
ncbi:MAG: hypothetical protein JWN09_1054 [Microbacteriaceae bacterium]|nr:hypothetical protein [Microbacteriaceae bacterium]